MRLTSAIPRADWLFVGAMFLLCAILTALQYRWTGELATAEMERARAGMGEEARQFCNAFDSALAESCAALTPPQGGELNGATRETAHEENFQKWRALNSRPLFRRVGVAAREMNGTQLFEQNLETGQLAPAAWPAEWSSLRQNLENKARGGGPTQPYTDATGALFEAPVFADSPGRGRPQSEIEWMIFEIDTNYLASAWLPELTQASLNPGGPPPFDVAVKSASSGSVLFATSRDLAANSRPLAELPFNRQGRDFPFGRRQGENFHWILEARVHPGALEGVVAAARRKNFAVAAALNLLMLATGLALAHHTRRSRRLAEQQMNFVAGVSHELRTPLTVIRGAAHNLERGVVTERSQIEKYSRLITENTRQLGDMVEQVLALAGAQRNSPSAMREPVALAEMLRDVVAGTAHDTQVAQCAVHLDVLAPLPPVLGNARELRSVFQNLIANAAKHGGGEIEITAVVDQNRMPPVIEIQVADRGLGIPANELGEIFKPFFRGARAREAGARGSGLGLSLAKEIVSAHGGEIFARNGGGRGAKFIVRLPAATIENSR